MSDAEAALVRRLFELAGAPSTLTADVLVEPMEDGGMGSFRFVYGNETERLRSVELVSALSKDADDVPLSIALNVDQHGRLFELDIWKVDFSPLQRLPRPDQVVAVKPRSR